MNTVEELLMGRSVLVCCGSGGVGKTTVAAALGIAGAQRGRRACIITIDPARRLADALDAAGLSNEPRAIEGDFDGELFAVMLDARATFDDLVRRYATDEEQVQEILTNAIYANLVSSLSGTQEYMATEKLFELHESGAFDLIVVDTPPSRAALDFLDAPNRLASFIDNRIFRLMLSPGKSYFKPLTLGSQLLLRTIARVAGSEIVDDAIAFFRAFEGMEEGFRERARRVENLLADPGTAFVLVVAPREDSIDESHFFARRLAEGSIEVSALVVNRLFSNFEHDQMIDGDTSPRKPVGERPQAEGFDEVSESSRPDPSAYEELRRNLEDFLVVATREERYVAELAGEVAPAPVVRVPFLSDDVHDIEGLRAVARHLLGGQLVSDRGSHTDRQ